MNIFRGFLVIIFVSLLGYTGTVVSTSGINLFPVFFGDMAKLEWPGQFNLDFMFMLSLAGLWVWWRHRFSAPGLLLGLGALFGGSLFLSAYLLIESVRVQGNMKALMLGRSRIDY
jgi:hypothetical protein